MEGIFKQSAGQGVEVIADAQRATKSLRNAVTKFHTCLYLSKHAFYFREICEWRGILEVRTDYLLNLHHVVNKLMTYSIEIRKCVTI